MKKRGRIVYKAKKKIAVTSYSRRSVASHSLTEEKEVSSPLSKHKKLRMSSVRVPSDGEKWAANVEGIFVDLMHEEVLRGNIYTSSFTPSVWKDIMNNLILQTGIAYSVPKLKSKHNRMKDLWRRFHALMLADTGLGWDEVTNMPIASPAQWDALIARNPIFAELRNKGCPHYHKLTTIFACRTATGYAARASTQMRFSENQGGSSSAAVGGGFENDEAGAQPSPMQAQTSARTSRRSSSQNRGDDDRDVLIQILEKVCDNNSSATAIQTDKLNTGPERVLEPLRQMTHLTPEQFIEALEFLRRESSHRRIFLAMTEHERDIYLRAHLKW